MALTVYYVADDGVTAWASNDSSNPSSLEEARTNAAAADHVKIKAGTYSLTTTSWTPTNSGTVADPIIWEGVDASWASIDNGRDTDLSLITTDFPLFTFTGAGRLLTYVKPYQIFQNIKITGASTNAIVYIGEDSVMVNCWIENTNTASGANTFALEDRSMLVNCDVIGTGTATSAGEAGTFFGPYNALVGCRVMNIAGPIEMKGENCRIIHCLIAQSRSTVGAIELTTGSSSICNISFNTIVDSNADGISLSNSDEVGVPTIVGNMITDNGRYGINNLYSGTADRMVYAVGNRFRNNVSGNYVGISVDCPTYDDETTDTGGQETDYVDAGSDNYQTIAASPAVGHVLGQWNAGWCKPAAAAAGSALPMMMQSGLYAGSMT